MEQEISSGTMLGIVLIALAAVIGLGFGVFSIAKGVANEGTVGVQDNLGTVSDSAYDDYNDKIVTGTMVKSAMQNFKGKSCAILVSTLAMDKEVKPYASHEALNVWVTDASNEFVGCGSVTGECTSLTKDKTKNAIKYFKLDASGAATEAEIKGTDGKLKVSHFYVNYNALLGNKIATPGTDGCEFTMGNANAKLKLQDGTFNATAIPFQINPTDGKVLFDYSVGGTTRTGNCEYLNATAKFDANLIKDETGTVLGIVFTQRAQ